MDRGLTGIWLWSVYKGKDRVKWSTDAVLDNFLCRSGNGGGGGGCGGGGGSFVCGCYPIGAIPNTAKLRSYSKLPLLH